MTEPVSPTSRWTLITRHLGWEVRVFDELDSTNSHALALADDPSLHGLILLARSQSAGRGQYGRTWESPTGHSVLLSILLFPPPFLRRPVLLTSWAAVAVGEVILDLTGHTARIKWPNDVLVAGKKVCGILIEQRTTGNADFPLATVVGIGLNVCQPDDMFVQAQLPDAGSLLSVSGKELAPDAVARALMHRLDEDYDRLLFADFGPLESLWQERLGLVGRSVSAELNEGRRRGRLIEAGFDGLVLQADGEMMRLAPESVRHLHLDETSV